MAGILLAMQGAVAQGVLWAIMTLGAYITYKVLNFADLSVDGTFALGGAVTATLIVQGVDPYLSLLAAMGAGMLGGLVTAVLHTKFQVPGLLSGILTMLGLYSINMRIMGSKANTPLLGQRTVMTALEGFLPFSSNVKWMLLGVLFCAALILLLYWFFGTEVGCALRATGNNMHMARALGTNTDNMIILGLMLSNGLVALGGALVAQNQGYADVGMGTGTMVIGLASIIIGQAVFRFMRRNFMLKLVTAVLGSVLYRIIIAVVLQLGIVKANDLKLFSAVLMALVLAIPVLSRRLKEHNRRRQDNRQGGGADA